MSDIKQRGRPKLSDEEKAQRALERKMKKRAEYRAKKEAGITDSELAVKLYKQMKADTIQPVLEESEAAQIAKMEQIMKRADDAKRSQYAVPKEESRTVGNRDLIHIARATEVSVEDTPRDERPGFVTKDEAGWEEF